MSEVTKEQITEWKAKYGKVVKLYIGGEDWYYRPITLDEYYEVQELVSLSEVKTEGVGQSQVIRICVLYPVVPEVIPTGVIIKLSEEILKISGFTSDNSIPEEL